MAREQLNEYLEAVGAQIRWKRARRPLLRELSDHIADQAAAFEAEGQSPGEALAAAVAEMGEPEAVGRELDRLHRPRSCWRLALTVAVLLGVGLALQLLACQVTGDSASDYYFRRQAVGLVLAVGVLVCLWFFDYTLLLRRKRMPIAAMAALCILPPLFAIFCTHVDYYLTPYQFVSAFLYPYLLLPIPFAALIATMRGSGPSRVFFCGLAASLLSVIPLWFLSPPACLVSGASMLIVLLSAILLGWFRGKRRWNFLAALGAFSVTLALHLPLYLHSALRRLAVFFHADTMPNGIVYQRIRAGELPSSFVGTSYDLLLLEVSQALGRWVFWAAAAGIVLLAALLLRRIFRLRSRTGKLTALAALCPLLFQAVIYWLYNLGWWPSGALSLPFLSYGVTFLLVDAALAGVLLSVFRMDALVRDAVAASARPVSLPEALNIPLGRGSLHIEYRKKA